MVKRLGNYVSATSGWATSISVTHNLLSGTNRIIMVAVLGTPGLVSSVTYGGVTMTSAGSSSIANTTGSLFYLLESSLPGDGDNTVTATYNTNSGYGSFIFVYCYCNVKSFRAGYSQYSDGVSPISNSITAYIGDFVFSYTANDGTGCTHTVNEGQIKIYEANSPYVKNTISELRYRYDETSVSTTLSAPHWAVRLCAVLEPEWTDGVKIITPNGVWGDVKSISVLSATGWQSVDDISIKNPLGLFSPV